MVIDQTPLPQSMLRPLKGPFEAGAEVAEYVAVIALVCAVAVAARSLGIFVRRQRPPAPGRLTPRWMTAFEAAYAQLPATITEFYDAASVTSRRCLECRFGIAAAVLSSTEIAAALVRIDGPQDIVPVLYLVDAVRFGGRVPSVDESRRVFARIEELMRDGRTR